MAAELDDIFTQVASATNEGAPADLERIQTILGDKDPKGEIAAQIYSCLENDEISLQLLSEFDDMSLNGIIDSWDLNFTKTKTKSFVIRGLLIKGIKALRTQNVQAAQTGPQQSETVQTVKKPTTAIENIISESEVQMLNLLQNLEENMVNTIDTIEKESKNNEEMIEMTFNNIINKINDRKTFLLDKILSTFNKTTQKSNDY